MIVSLIAAISQNWVIGRGNQLPWHLPDDMRYFMDTTLHHHVVMGRKSYEALPQQAKPLPHRTNVVITRQSALKNTPYLVVTSPQAALQLAQQRGEQEVFVIGGGQIYDALFPFAHRLYLTEVQAMVIGDIYFPAFDRDEWIEIERKHHIADHRHPFAFDFVKYERKLQKAREVGKSVF